MTSRPPALTSTFTPSPSCLSYQYATSDHIAFQLRLGPVTNFSTCLPSGWATEGDSYFSPGICPSGYVSACSTTPSTTSGETTVTCCPSGYTCHTSADANILPFYCMSIRTTESLSRTIDYYVNESSSTQKSIGNGGAVNALGVQIRFKATDFVSTTTSSPRTTTSAMTGTLITDFASPSATGSVTATPAPGLSTGAKAGIGVGVAIGVLGLLILGALIIWRRRRNLKTDQLPTTDYRPYGMDTKQELDGNSRARSKVAELDASDPSSGTTASQPEMRTQDPILPGTSTARGAELEGRAITSRKPVPLASPPVQVDDATGPKDPTASKEIHSHELGGAAPEMRSAAFVPYESRSGKAEEDQYVIQQRIKRIREEKERLTRINELERMEAELEARLAGESGNVKK